MIFEIRMLLSFIEPLHITAIFRSVIKNVEQGHPCMVSEEAYEFSYASSIYRYDEQEQSNFVIQ